jgi:hypothetical protein
MVRMEKPFGRLYVLRCNRIGTPGAVAPPPGRRRGNRKGFISRKKLIDTMFAWG